MKQIYSFLDISTIKRISFRNDINGLRAISVLAVVFYHADIPFFDGGWLGVDVFFVISGYLISNIIISELNENKFSFGNFYIRRAKRILPALFSMLLFTVPFSYFLLTPKAMIEYTQSLFSSIFFYANYYFQNLDFYNATPTKFMPLLHTWSLAIEEQFYLIFPLICFLIYKINKQIFTLSLSIFLIFSVFLNSTTSELLKFYQIQYRAWELVLGAIVMIFQNKINIKYIEKAGIAILFFSIFYFDDTTLTINSIEPRIVSNLGVALLLLSSYKGIVNKFLSSNLLKYIGLSSYSVYLFHQPLFAFSRLFQNKYGLLQSKYLMFVLLILLFLISYLNWKYVEKVFQIISVKKFFICLALVLIFLLFFVFISLEEDGFIERFNHVPENVLFYSTNPNIYPLTFSRSDYKYSEVNCDSKIYESSYCIWSNASNQKNIYLIGDSQTNALSVAFLTEFEGLKNEYNLIFLRGKLGRCILSQQSDSVGLVGECSSEAFNNFIATLDSENDLIIAFGRFDTWLEEKGKNEIKCENCNYVNVFKSRLEILASNVNHAYYVKPIPTYSYSVSESYLYKRNTWGDPVTLELTDWNNKARKTHGFLKSLDGENITLIETVPVFCDEVIKKKCYASTESELYYSDSNHLTHDGGKLLAREIEKKIQNSN